MKPLVSVTAAVVIGLFANLAVAHNVVSGAYADGMMIEGEIGFSSGEMAAAGVLITVFNEAGEKQGETVLEEGGFFTYQAKAVDKHVFKANLSSGHVAEMVIEADELSSDLSSEKVAITPQASSQPTSLPTGIAVGVSPEALQAMVRSAVAQQIRPLQKELKAYKEKVMFRDIAGGLGFIFGLFGVAAWMASKREGKQS